MKSTPILPASVMKTEDHPSEAHIRRDGRVRTSPILLTALVCVLANLWASGGISGALAEEAAPPAGAAATASATPSIRSSDEIGRWVVELGHDVFTVRQRAASRLLAAGILAREPLLSIVDGPDPETRASARRLVALIDQTEFHRRLEAFAADTDGHQNVSLPGWDQYQKLVGNDTAARALFVEMQRQEGGLLSAAFGGSQRTPEELLNSRLLRLVQWQVTVGDRTASPPLGSCAAMLFLGSVSEVDVSDSAATFIEILLSRSPIAESLRAENRHDPVRRLVVGWLLHCPTKTDTVLYRRLQIISAVGLEEVLPLPLAVIARDAQYKRVRAPTRAYATLIVGQFGRPEHVDRLEPLLEDTSVCIPPQVQVPGQPIATVQVRDVALAVMLQLSGQRLADFGYANARFQQPKLFQIQTLARDNDQQRAESIAKWREWRADQKATRSAAKAN
jgi:hypothetical protein